MTINNSRNTTGKTNQKLPVIAYTFLFGWLLETSSALQYSIALLLGGNVTAVCYDNAMK